MYEAEDQAATRNLQKKPSLTDPISSSLKISKIKFKVEMLIEESQPVSL